MSKIGKQPITVPQGVTVAIDGRDVLVKGPKGELSFVVPAKISVDQNDSEIVLALQQDNKITRSLWGLWRSLLANAVKGVSEGYEMQLELVGVGYRVQSKGTALELELGLSHKIVFEPMDGVALETEKGVITVKGIDKQKVGQTAAKLRGLRPPEPYKGKGVRYVGEVVKLKPGKAAKVGA